VNFLSIDCHIAVSADIRYIFNQLGHQVTEYSLSGHARVIGRPLVSIDMLNGNEWCETINKKKFKEFYTTYKSFFNKFDGFICCYPPVFAWLYMFFDKPIIIHIPIRYELGVEHTKELWEEFNRYLKGGIKSGQIKISANNIYDKVYTEGYLKEPVAYIPSLCEYTGMSYNPVRDLYLYYSCQDVPDAGGRMVKKHSILKAGHAWQTVADFKGCIHYPYNVSTMSTFEQYMANQPLFFPSKKYLMDLWGVGKVLSQISWRQQTPHLPAKSLIDSTHSLDPNNYKDLQTVSSWINYADFYAKNMKEIVLFDDEEEIFSLSTIQLLEISDKMRIDNIKRKKEVYAKWDTVLRSIK
jgi:hypothetical protein